MLFSYLEVSSLGPQLSPLLTALDQSQADFQHKLEKGVKRRKTPAHRGTGHRRNNSPTLESARSGNRVALSETVPGPGMTSRARSRSVECTLCDMGEDTLQTSDITDGVRTEDLDKQELLD